MSDNVPQRTFVNMFGPHTSTAPSNSTNSAACHQSVSTRSELRAKWSSICPSIVESVLSLYCDQPHSVSDYRYELVDISDSTQQNGSLHVSTLSASLEHDLFVQPSSCVVLLRPETREFLDQFKGMDQPLKVLDCGFFTLAPKWPLYPAATIISKRPIMEQAFISQFKWMYGCWLMGVSSHTDVEGVPMELWYSKIANRAHQVYWNYVTTEGWVDVVLDWSELGDEDSKKLKNACSNVQPGNIQSMIEALLPLCWYGLYRAFDEVDRQRSEEDFTASCLAEACHMCWRIIRSWAIDAWNGVLPADRVPIEEQ